MTHDAPRIDFRHYIGIILFRWYFIVLSFLLFLLGAVIYITVSRPQYLTHCKLIIHRDKNLDVARTAQTPWQALATHVELLQSDELRGQVMDKLMEKWAGPMGGRNKMRLNVTASPDRRMPSTLDVSVQSGKPEYGEAFLTEVLDEHKLRWDRIQRSAMQEAVNSLQDELASLVEEIESAENDLIEYRRVHDIYLTERKGTMEMQYLEALMKRQNSLTTELLLLEAKYPELKGDDPLAISAALQLARETGEVEPELESLTDAVGEDGKLTVEAVEELRRSMAVDNVLPSLKTGKSQLSDEEVAKIRGWEDLRTRLTHLEAEDAELAKSLKPEHQERRKIAREIESIKKELKLAAESEMRKLKDRREAIVMELRALETAVTKWQAKSYHVSQKQAELKRKIAAVDRYESNYKLLYEKLHNLKTSEELKADHFYRMEPGVTTYPDPVWPAKWKILFVAMAGGLAAGLGLTVLAQAMDNKIQTIADVEREIGIPFLGGVPFWAYSGLEDSVRPIVTEESSTGAVEAYRALRTTILKEMEKVNENILLVTSADSQEGKTLTALNLAIITAQMKKRVLLIDMDLRRGRIHKSLGLSRVPGVTDALKRNVDLKDVVMPTRVENLWFAPCGNTIENAAELLQETDLHAFFEEAGKMYDYVIVDTSPVLRVTDTVISASQGLGVILYVARVNKTPKPMIRYSLDMLKDARILGLVMNSIEMHKASSLYYAYQYPNYAYYSNAYAYGHDYYYSSGTGKDGKSRAGKWARKWHDITKWMRHTFMPME